ncbi:hypothetical protein HPB47_017294 [Ixodes persulcatus]|uniref:Uncharacterized protein n=1 Tax=Ixodes persulcatus TaxID=34615 RepID=A0AC60QNM9_IXOPE|nr:hypothetical protein HPB47_017294 [Ixodes persulcatus]
MAALEAEHGDAERAERPFDTEALIELVSDTKAVRAQWTECFFSEGTAASKFANLKDHWRRLKNKLDAAKKSGAGASDVPKIAWRYFAIINSMMATERLGT